MKALRMKLKADAEKMAYICSAIDKMIIAAKEAEERRAAAEEVQRANSEATRRSSDLAKRSRHKTKERSKNTDDNLDMH